LSVNQVEIKINLVSNIVKKICILFILIFTFSVGNCGTYTIDGEFDGCDYEKKYPLVSGGVLECQEYNYFYEYSPDVRTDGREVILIGREKVRGVIRDGSVIRTKVKDTFEGCDYDKRIPLDNGLIFVCSTYGYTYAYRPDVMIIVVSGGLPEVYIKGKKYSGTLYRR